MSSVEPLSHKRLREVDERQENGWIAATPKHCLTDGEDEDVWVGHTPVCVSLSFHWGCIVIGAQDVDSKGANLLLWCANVRLATGFGGGRNAGRLLSCVWSCGEKRITEDMGKDSI